MEVFFIRSLYGICHVNRAPMCNVLVWIYDYRQHKSAFIAKCVSSAHKSLTNWSLLLLIPGHDITQDQLSLYITVLTLAQHNTARWRYNTVLFLPYSHKGHPITMRYGVSFASVKYDLGSAVIIAALHMIARKLDRIIAALDCTCFGIGWRRWLDFRGTF